MRDRSGDLAVHTTPGAPSTAATRLHDVLRRGLTIELLVSAGVLTESTGKKRDRAFAYEAYLDRLKVGTELSRPTR